MYYIMCKFCVIVATNCPLANPQVFSSEVEMFGSAFFKQAKID